MCIQPRHNSPSAAPVDLGGSGGSSGRSRLRSAAPAGCPLSGCGDRQGTACLRLPAGEGAWAEARAPRRANSAPASPPADCCKLNFTPMSRRSRRAARRRGGRGAAGSAAELAQPPARRGGHFVSVCPPVLPLSPRAGPEPPTAGPAQCPSASAGAVSRVGQKSVHRRVSEHSRLFLPGMTASASGMRPSRRAALVRSGTEGRGAGPGMLGVRGGALHG